MVVHWDLPIPGYRKEDSYIAVFYISTPVQVTHKNLYSCFLSLYQIMIDTFIYFYYVPISSVSTYQYTSVLFIWIFCSDKKRLGNILLYHQIKWNFPGYILRVGLNRTIICNLLCNLVSFNDTRNKCLFLKWSLLSWIIYRSSSI